MYVPILVLFSSYSFPPIHSPPTSPYIYLTGSSYSHFLTSAQSTRCGIAGFFKHVSKGRGRVSRLLVQMVRLLGILRANDVACCHLNPDNVLLVPGDSNERFTLMVG